MIQTFGKGCCNCSFQGGQDGADGVLWPGWFRVAKGAAPSRICSSGEPPGQRPGLRAPSCLVSPSISLHGGGSLPGLPGVWGRRGRAQGSQNQAPAPLEGRGTNAAGLCRGFRLLPPGLLPSQGGCYGVARADVFRQLQGRPPCGTQQAVCPPRAAEGRPGELVSSAGSGVATPEEESVLLFFLLFQKVPAAWLPSGGRWFLRTQGTGTEEPEP